MLLGVGILLIVVAGCADTPSSQPVTITPLALSPGATSPVPGKTSTATASPVSSSDWTTYHYNNARTGYVANTLDPSQLTRAWGVQLDGAVYAEPLVVGQRVIVATEGDSFYALDKTTGKVQWHTNVGTPVPLSTLPCGHIDP